MGMEYKINKITQEEWNEPKNTLGKSFFPARYQYPRAIKIPGGYLLHKGYVAEPIRNVNTGDIEFLTKV